MMSIATYLGGHLPSASLNKTQLLLVSYAPLPVRGSLRHNVSFLSQL